MHPRLLESTLMLLFSLVALLMTGCGASPLDQATMTAVSDTQTATVWTSTYTATFTATSTSTPTFTPTLTPTITDTPTITFTPTITPSPTFTLTPTFNFPTVRVNQTLATCRFGPAKVFLYRYTLEYGYQGLVWGRAPYGGSWLYVKMKDFPKACWVSPYVVDVTGDVNTVIVEDEHLIITNELYGPPTNVYAVREGDQVTVHWDEVWMTEDDDRGYLLQVFVCQGGNYVWIPAATENQYQTSYTFTDQKGCAIKSRGEIRTVEKHGYTDAVEIPWPP
jgi:hypothetical protein